MYSNVNSISTNLSVALSLDALAHVKHKNINYLAVHDTEKVSVISIGGNVTSNKEITFEATNDDNRNFIQTAKLLVLYEKVYLVVCSSKTLKIYAEENDLQLAFTFSLSSECKLGQIVHSVQALNKSIFGVATETKVHFFAVSRHGANFKSKEMQPELKANARSLIHCFASNGNSQCAVVESMNNAGVSGLIGVWKYEEDGNDVFSSVNSIAIHFNTKATGVLLHRDLIILVTISGQIQLLSLSSGRLLSEIHAHVRCITSCCISSKTGYLVTTSEDSNLRIFRIVSPSEDKCKVELVHQMIIPDEIICGVKFLNSSGSQFAICTYETSTIQVFKQTK